MRIERVVVNASPLGTLYGLTRVARGSAVSETKDIDCGHISGLLTEADASQP